MCISSKFPGGADADSLETSLRIPVLYYIFRNIVKLERWAQLIDSYLSVYPPTYLPIQPSLKNTTHNALLSLSPKGSVHL